VLLEKHGNLRNVTRNSVRAAGMVVEEIIARRYRGAAL
jgi:hypothetical protein